MTKNTTANCATSLQPGASTNLTANAFSAFIHRHFILFLASIVLVSFASIIISSKKAEAYKSIPLDLSLSTKKIEAEPETSAPTPLSQTATQPSINASANVEVKTPEPQWKEYMVRPGDSLSTVFQKMSIPVSELHNYLKKSQRFNELLNLYPGQTLAFITDDNGAISQLRYDKNRLESLLFTRTESNAFSASDIIKQPEVITQHATGVIQNSLFVSASEAGLPGGKIMELAGIFGGVIDFVYDLRKGDRFDVIYEETFLDGEKIGYGNIIAAQITNRNNTYKAFRYTDLSDRTDYYNEDGESMRKAFLRAPLDFTRISSNFNLHRLHPIHKKVKAHRGIDYAAPRGTPIYSAGDGRVIKSGYSAPNGNYVFIQHGPQYVTKYIHLDKRKVKTGQRVVQKQVIGTVGSTGYATGPHLHYEFLVNGVHRNPRTIVEKLPKAKSVDNNEKIRFLTAIEGRKLQLATFEQQILLGKNTSE